MRDGIRCVSFFFNAVSMLCFSLTSQCSYTHSDSLCYWGSPVGTSLPWPSSMPRTLRHDARFLYFLCAFLMSLPPFSCAFHLPSLYPVIHPPLAICACIQNGVHRHDRRSHRHSIPLYTYSSTVLPSIISDSCSCTCTYVMSALPLHLRTLHAPLPFPALFLPFTCPRLCASRSLLPCLTLVRIWTISGSGLVFTVLARCPCVPITANHCTSTNASKGFFFHSFRYIAVAYPSGGTLCVSSASATPVSTREPFCRDPRPPREKLCPADHELEGYVQGFDIGSLQSLQRAEWKPAQKKQY